MPALPETLVKGVRAESGEWLRAKRVENLRQGMRNTWFVIILDEGKNRHIRRMFESLGIEVLRLIRISIGPLELGNLAKGACRQFTEREKQALDAAMRRTISGHRHDEHKFEPITSKEQVNPTEALVSRPAGNQVRQRASRPD